MLPFSERIINVSRDNYLPSHNRGIPVPKEPKTIGDHLRKRRLQLGIHQSEAARRLGISTVTLSRWECDKVYPTWQQQPIIIKYLGYDPFTDPVLGRPTGNERSGVAALSSEAPKNLGESIRETRLQMRKTCNQLATEIGVDVKTLRGWESGEHQPIPNLLRRLTDYFKANNEPTLH
jgi:transcriptional regulator with XRE-family HTH domain